MKINPCKSKYPIYCDVKIKDNKDIHFIESILDKTYASLIKTKGGFILNSENRIRNERNVPVIISGRKPPKNEYDMSDRELAELIVKKVESFHGSSEELTDIVEKLLKDQYLSGVVSGKYFHDGFQSFVYEQCDYYRFESDSLRFEEDDARPYIVIFYECFKKENTDEVVVSLSNCLAHEFFHFHHDCLACKEFNKRSPGTPGMNRKRVVESLADYFSIAYTLQSNIRYPDACQRFAEKRYANWENRMGTKWPYAYAHCICPRGLGELRDSICSEDSRKSFNKVLEESKKSMTDAYKSLIGGKC